MSALVAVYSRNGKIVHLYLPGFRPGNKPRDPKYPTAMCGQPAHCVSGVGYPHESPTGRVHVPFRKAIELERSEVVTDDPRPFHAAWAWCPLCIGRALDYFDLTAGAITALADAEGVIA